MRPKTTYYVVSNPYSADTALQVLFAGHSQTHSGHKVGPKVFDYYLIHYILSGRGVFTCGDHTFELQKGDSFIIEPGTLVTYMADSHDAWQYRWLAFQGLEAEELLKQVGVTWHAPVVHHSQGNRISRLIEQIQSIFINRKNGGNLQAKGCLYMLLSELQEAIQPDAQQEAEVLSTIERRVKQVAAQLTTQYTEPISIERLADSLGYNRAYFSKMFKQFIHVSPVTFLLNMRIGKARQMLRERMELTIEQVAYSVGFNDALYFSKQFRRFYGISPSQYRKSVEHLKKT